MNDNHYRHEEGDWFLTAEGAVALPHKDTKGWRLLFVCTVGRPSPYARPLKRLGEAEWSLAPVEYINGHFEKIPDEGFILLTGGPDDVNERLATYL